MAWRLGLIFGFIALAEASVRLDWISSFPRRSIARGDGFVASCGTARRCY
jgi:hypothetical protein